MIKAVYASREKEYNKIVKLVLGWGQAGAGMAVGVAVAALTLMLSINKKIIETNLTSPPEAEDGVGAAQAKDI